MREEVEEGGGRQGKVKERGAGGRRRSVGAGRKERGARGRRRSEGGGR